MISSLTSPIISGCYPEAYLGCGLNSSRMVITLTSPIKTGPMEGKTTQINTQDLNTEFFLVDSLADLNLKLNSTVNSHAHLLDLTSTPVGLTQLQEPVTDMLYFGVIITHTTSKASLENIISDDLRLNDTALFEDLFYYGDYYVKQVNCGQQIAIIVKVAIHDSRYIDVIHQIVTTSSRNFLTSSASFTSLPKAVTSSSQKISNTLSDIMKRVRSSCLHHVTTMIMDYTVSCCSNIPQLNQVTSTNETALFFAKLEEAVSSPTLISGVISLELALIVPLLDETIFQAPYRQYEDFQNRILNFLKQAIQLHTSLVWLLHLLSKQLDAYDPAFEYWQNQKEAVQNKIESVKTLFSTGALNITTMQNTFQKMAQYDQSVMNIAQDLYDLFNKMNRRCFIQAKDPIQLELVEPSSRFNTRLFAAEHTQRKYISRDRPISQGPSAVMCLCEYIGQLQTQSQAFLNANVTQQNISELERKIQDLQYKQDQLRHPSAAESQQPPPHADTLNHEALAFQAEIDRSQTILYELRTRAEKSLQQSSHIAQLEQESERLNKLLQDESRMSKSAAGICSRTPETLSLNSRQLFLSKSALVSITLLNNPNAVLLFKRSLGFLTSILRERVDTIGDILFDTGTNEEQNFSFWFFRKHQSEKDQPSESRGSQWLDQLVCSQDSVWIENSAFSEMYLSLERSGDLTGLTLSRQPSYFKLISPLTPSPIAQFQQQQLKSAFPPLDDPVALERTISHQLRL